MRRARMIGLVLLAACGGGPANETGGVPSPPDSGVSVMDSVPAADAATDVTSPDAAPVDAPEADAPPAPTVPECTSFGYEPPPCVVAVLGLPAAGRMTVGYRVCCPSGRAVAIVEAHPAPPGQGTDWTSEIVDCGVQRVQDMSYDPAGTPEAELMPIRYPYGMDDLIGDCVQTGVTP